MAQKKLFTNRSVKKISRVSKTIDSSTVRTTPIDVTFQEIGSTKKIGSVRLSPKAYVVGPSGRF